MLLQRVIFGFPSIEFHRAMKALGVVEAVGSRAVEEAGAGKLSQLLACHHRVLRNFETYLLRCRAIMRPFDSIGAFLLGCLRRSASLAELVCRLKGIEARSICLHLDRTRRHLCDTRFQSVRDEVWLSCRLVFAEVNKRARMRYVCTCSGSSRDRSPPGVWTRKLGELVQRQLWTQRRRPPPPTVHPSRRSLVGTSFFLRLSRTSRPDHVPVTFHFHISSPVMALPKIAVR